MKILQLNGHRRLSVTIPVNKNSSADNKLTSAVFKVLVPDQFPQSLVVFMPLHKHSNLSVSVLKPHVPPVLWHWSQSLSGSE
jgi:hypothetical protein